MTSLRSNLGRALPVAAVLLALGAMLSSAFPMEPGLDYFHDSSAAIDALARGDFQGFLGARALMGNFSLFLRAPFVALVSEQRESIVYLAGALPCLAAVVAVGMILRRRMLALGRTAAAAALVCAIALLNPGTFRALHWGHPEELLAGALCVGAILAATRGRTLVAGLLLGLAVATKQWALIAVVPTLLAAPGRRVGVGLVAAAVALSITLPTILGAPATFVSVQTEAATADGPVGAPNVWWLVSSPRSVEERLAHVPGFGYAIPGWLSRLTHPAIVLAGLPLGWLFWRRRRELAPADALGLFALLMLVRCLMDPWNIDYYHAPFLLGLLAWEAVARDGWPRLTLLAGAALALTFPAELNTIGAMTREALRYNATYLIWAAPLAAWLGMTLFAPAARDALLAAARARLRRRPAARAAAAQT